MSETRTTASNGHVREATATVTGATSGIGPLSEAPIPPDLPGPASFGAVLNNGPFRALWIAQIFSQLAQNLTWITMGAFVQAQTGKSTLVSIIIVSAMLAQLFLSGFAGVLVDRVSKRAVLVGSNAIRVVITLLFIVTTPLDVGIQTSAIIILIFLANAVAQFFAPAEAATIPLLIEKRNLIVASSLFSITFNACQILPVTLGLLLLDLLGIVPVLLGVTACYVVAALLVATLPELTAAVRPTHSTGSLRDASLREAAGHVIGDVREALHFLARDPGLRLTVFQVNVVPTFLFIFGVLGLKFVRETFGVPPERAWILLLPAGIGLIVGALSMGHVATRVRKEDLINMGLLAMGVSVTVLGAVAVIVNVIDAAMGGIGGFISRHTHLPTAGYNLPLIPLAMLIALVIGLAMAMSTIPAQALVFERTSEDLRGRVLSMQQLIGGAVPIIPLLVVAPLADVFGTSTVMTGLGIVIVLIGAFSVRLERGLRQ